MKKPTIAEIEAYCKERRNNVDSEKFWHYYESIGWKVGKQAMVKWKSAVITWERNTTHPVAIKQREDKYVVEKKQRKQREIPRSEAPDSPELIEINKRIKEINDRIWKSRKSERHKVFQELNKLLKEKKDIENGPTKIGNFF